MASPIGGGRWLVNARALDQAVRNVGEDGVVAVLHEDQDMFRRWRRADANTNRSTDAT